MASTEIAPGGPWDPLNWFSGATSAVYNWLGGIGGQLASGVESGVISVFKDLWAVAAGFVEIGIGAIIAFVVLAVYFGNKNSRMLNAMAGIAAKAAVLAA